MSTDLFRLSQEITRLRLLERQLLHERTDLLAELKRPWLAYDSLVAYVQKMHDYSAEVAKAGGDELMEEASLMFYRRQRADE